MRHENQTSQSSLERSSSFNQETIATYQNGERGGFTSLALDDTASMEVAHVLPECDEINRQMLDEVYQQVGLNSGAPDVTRTTHYRDGRSVDERIFLLSNAGSISEATSHGTGHSSFSVIVSAGQFL